MGDQRAAMLLSAFKHSTTSIGYVLQWRINFSSNGSMLPLKDDSTKVASERSDINDDENLPHTLQSGIVWCVDSERSLSDYRGLALT